MHLDDIAVIELRERLRLVDEAVEAPIVVARRACRARVRLEIIGPAREIARKIFLDADLPREIGFFREIRDAEPARAEHAHDFIIAREFGSVR